MRNQTIFMLAVIVLLLGTTAEAQYCGGEGTPEEPYRICTAADMNEIGACPNDWDKHFILVNDIDLADYTGTQFNIIGNDSNPFTGVFDGNDHIIENFTWNSIGANDIGLFGRVGGDGKIENLGVEDVNVYALSGENVGGLVGENGGEIINCYSTGSVWGDYKVGGLVGYNKGHYDESSLGEIINCYSDANVTADEYIGGLVGSNYGAIVQSYSTGSVLGGSKVGGLAGINKEAIRDCYSKGSVSGEGGVGGLIGLNTYPLKVSSCYACGEVDGNSSVGGFTGIDNQGFTLYVSCFWDCNVNPPPITGIGNMDDRYVTEVKGETTANMKTLSTFTDPNLSSSWNFVCVWRMCQDGVEYPLLVWQFDECFPCTPEYEQQYDDYLLYKQYNNDPNKVDCWCGCPDGNHPQWQPWLYQCDGDADGATQGFWEYRVYNSDLTILIDNWKKKITDPNINPCADFDHKGQGFWEYRVYSGDLTILIDNWKKKDSELPGDCPRPDVP